MVGTFWYYTNFEKRQLFINYLREQEVFKIQASALPHLYQSTRVVGIPRIYKSRACER